MIAGGAHDRPHKRGTGDPGSTAALPGRGSRLGAQRRSVESRRGSAEVERWLALGPHALLEERSDGVDGKARAASYVHSDPPGIATTPREGPSVQARPDEHRALREGACLHGRAQIRGWSRSGHGGEPSLPAGSSHARLTGISRCIDVGCRRRDDVGGTHRTGTGRPAYAGAPPAYRLRMLALGLRMLRRRIVPAGGRRPMGRQRPGGRGPLVEATLPAPARRFRAPRAPSMLPIEPIRLSRTRTSSGWNG
jgi:hypothetical protein